MHPRAMDAVQFPCLLHRRFFCAACPIEAFENPAAGNSVLSLTLSALINRKKMPICPIASMIAATFQLPALRCLFLPLWFDAASGMLRKRKEDGAWKKKNSPSP